MLLGLAHFNKHNKCLRRQCLLFPPLYAPLTVQIDCLYALELMNRLLCPIVLEFASMLSS